MLKKNIIWCGGGGGGGWSICHHIIMTCILHKLFYCLGKTFRHFLHFYFFLCHVLIFNPSSQYVHLLCESFSSLLNPTYMVGYTLQFLFIHIEWN